MPGLDGIDLLQATKSYDDVTPVILMTGDDDLGLQYHALTMGAYAFLQKPIDPGRLLLTVDGALKNSNGGVGE